MDERRSVMLEIRELLKKVSDQQEQLLTEVQEMRLEQKRLHEEIRENNFVLSNIALRTEILN